MKKCPYCFEEIKDEAIVCRYCRRELPGYEEEIKRRMMEAGRLIQSKGVNRQTVIEGQEPLPKQDKPEIVPTPTPNYEEINRPSQPVMQESSPHQVKHDDILPQIPNIEDINKPTQTVAQVSPSRQDKPDDILTQAPDPNYRKNTIVVIALIVIVICVLFYTLYYLSIQKANSSASTIETNTAQTLEAINKTNVIPELNSTTMPNPTNTEEFTETPIPTDTPFHTDTPEPTNPPEIPVTIEFSGTLTSLSRVGGKATLEVTIKNTGARDIKCLAIKLNQSFAEKIIPIGSDPQASTKDFWGNKYIYFGPLPKSIQKTYKIFMSPIYAGEFDSIIQFAEACSGLIGPTLEDVQGNAELHAKIVVIY